MKPAPGLIRAGSPAAPFLASLLPLLTPETYPNLAPKHQLGVSRLAADIGPSADLSALFSHLAAIETPDLARIEPVLYLISAQKRTQEMLDKVKEGAKGVYIVAQEKAGEAREQRGLVEGKLVTADADAKPALEEVRDCILRLALGLLT